LTHTNPCPPPAAGATAAVAAVSVLVELVVVAGAAEGEAPTELFGLKKSARVFFVGDDEGVAVGETAAVPFALRPCFVAAEGDASVVAAGEGAVAAVVFFVLRVRFSAGEGDASVPAADEAPLVAAGEAVLVASVFL
jgi:hypothetical protein